MRTKLEVAWSKDHPGRYALDLPVRALERGLRRLGHSTTGIEEPVDVRFCFGAHLPVPEAGIDRIRGAVVIGTEPLHPWTGDDLDAYVIRLRAAREVWCLHDGNAEHLRSLGIRARTWRYGPDAFPRFLPSQSEKAWDYLFVGQVTPHRARVLERIKSSGVKVAASAGLPHYDHARAIGAARAILVLAREKGDAFPWPEAAWALSQGGSVLTDADHGWGTEWCGRLGDPPLTRIPPKQGESDSILRTLLEGLS